MNFSFVDGHFYLFFFIEPVPDKISMPERNGGEMINLVENWRWSHFFNSGLEIGKETHEP